jgi:putative DNA primase/helicase
LLAEGFATAATLHQATGHAAAACFSCGNLLSVARALRGKFPTLRLVLCADNDVNTPGNPGLTKAREAARAVGGWLAVPVFNRQDQPCQT